MKKIYVVCPYGLVTGGPDALHQMVYYLNKNGFDASIIYSDIKSHKYSIPKEYEIYIKQYMLLDEIADDKDNAIIVPETENNLLKQYSNMEKYLWWLSVDNDINSSGSINKIKKILKKLSWKNIKKLYKINTLKNFIKHSKYNFEEKDNTTHLCASYYAYDYVTKSVKNGDNVKLCIEPISKIFLEKSKLIKGKKEDIILYNPKKNCEFTKKIINADKNHKYIPLKGFSQEELIKMYQKAKVYIDFGTFPGAERIPKEAVINGCCIITGRYGASNYYEDVKINDKYKIEAKEENISNIVSKIDDLVNNYDDRINEYEDYRNTVWALESNFTKQINEIFK